MLRIVILFILQVEGTHAEDEDEEKLPSASALPPPQKKTAMSDLFGELFTTGEQHPKPLSATIEGEVALYRAAESLHIDGNPFQWWKLHQHKFPCVSKHAKRYLCVPGTSVASERVFSTAGDIVSATRSCLSPENVDMLIFLQKNMKTE